jgi:hypothetical protein
MKNDELLYFCDVQDNMMEHKKWRRTLKGDSFLSNLLMSLCSKDMKLVK